MIASSKIHSSVPRWRYQSLSGLPVSFCSSLYCLCSVENPLPAKVSTIHLLFLWLRVTSSSSARSRGYKETLFRLSYNFPSAWRRSSKIINYYQTFSRTDMIGIGAQFVSYSVLVCLCYDLPYVACSNVSQLRDYMTRPRPKPITFKSSLLI